MKFDIQFLDILEHLAVGRLKLLPKRSQHCCLFCVTAASVDGSRLDEMKIVSRQNKYTSNRPFFSPGYVEWTLQLRSLTHLLISVHSASLYVTQCNKTHNTFSLGSRWKEKKINHVRQLLDCSKKDMETHSEEDEGSQRKMGMRRDGRKKKETGKGKATAFPHQVLALPSDDLWSSMNLTFTPTSHGDLPAVQRWDGEQAFNFAPNAKNLCHFTFINKQNNVC